MKTLLKLLVAAALVFGGLYVILDSGDRRCRGAAVAKGVACPDGCAPRPPRSPEERYGVPECRSRLWVATCGKACAPMKGLVRLPDGELASSGVLAVELKNGADIADVSARLEAAGVKINGGLFGLNRYLAEFSNPGDDLKRLQQMRKKIESIDLMLTVAYDIR